MTKLPISNAQRVKVGNSDIICIPAHDYDEIINQFYKLYYEKQKSIPQLTLANPARLEERDPNSLLNVREAAKFLGIGKSTFYSHLKQPGAPKPIKIGHSTRYKYSDLLRFVERFS